MVNTNYSLFWCTLNRFIHTNTDNFDALSMTVISKLADKVYDQKRKSKENDVKRSAKKLHIYKILLLNKQDTQNNFKT